MKKYLIKIESKSAIPNSGIVSHSIYLTVWGNNKSQAEAQVFRKFSKDDYEVVHNFSVPQLREDNG